MILLTAEKNKYVLLLSDTYGVPHGTNIIRTQDPTI